MLTEPALSDIDPFDPATIENPFPFFSALRREAPLYELPNGAYWLVSRFEDCRRIVLDTDTFSSRMVGVMIGEQGEVPRLLPLPDETGTNVLAIADPPDHTRQRKLVNQAFAPRSVAKLESTVASLVEELLGEILIDSKVDTDLMSSYAVPLPMTVICHLLGFPLDHRETLQTLSDDAINLVDGINTTEQVMQYARSAGMLGQYMRTRLREAYEAGDELGECVLATLADAVLAEGNLLSEDEAVAILVQLVTAGQETTGSLIGSAILLLARHPTLENELREDPALLPAFIEETLRLESPFYGHFRQATIDTEIAGRPVAAGTRLMVLWASANRDADVFEAPDVINLNRENLRGHLGFGHGAHLCIGAELARMEARVALTHLLAKCDRIEAREANPRHVRSLFVRRLCEVPVTLHRN